MIVHIACIVVFSCCTHFNHRPNPSNEDEHKYTKDGVWGSA